MAKKDPVETTAKKSPSKKVPAKSSPAASSKKRAVAPRTASKETASKKTSAKSSTADPSSKTGTFDDLIAQAPPQAAAIARRLRQIVYEILPDAEETVWIKGWRLALYKDVSEVCGIGTVKDYVNFYLTRGAEIADPDRLLEGKGKGIRHVKVRSLDDMPEEAIRRFIREGRGKVGKV